jgi:hypothetical protein
VWRLLLIPAAVVAIGAAAVQAGGFPTSAEDLSSYSTSTTLAEPCTPTVLPANLWLRGPASADLGTLDLEIPPVFDTPSVREIDNQLIDRLTDEDDRGDYAAWASPPAPLCGFVLAGRPTLTIDQDGSRDDLLTAGLFRCPASAPAATTTPSCQLLVSGVAEAVGNSAPRDADGFLVRTVSFGTQALNTLIHEGQQLRVKVVNSRYQILIFAGGSIRDWDLKWGYRADRQARLAIAP